MSKTGILYGLLAPIMVAGTIGAGLYGGVKLNELKEENNNQAIVIEDLENALVELDSELETKEASIISLQAQLDSANSSVVSLSVQLDAKNSELQNVVNQRDSLLTQVENLNQDKATLNATLNEKNNEITELNNQIISLQAEIESLEVDIENANSSIANLNQQIANKNIEIETLTSQKEEVETALATALSDKETLQNQLNEKIERVNTLESQISEKNETILSLNTELATANADIQDYIANIETLNQTIADYQSFKLGKYVCSELVDDGMFEDIFVEILDNGRFRLYDDTEHYEEYNYSIANESITVEYQEDGEDVGLHFIMTSNVSFECVDEGNEMTFVYCDENLEHAIETRQYLQNSLETEKQSKNALETELQTANANIVSLTNAISEKDIEIQGLTNEKSQLILDLAQANADKESLQTQLDNANVSIANLQSQLNTANADLVQANSDLSQANADKLSLQNQLDSANSTINSLNTEIEEKNQSISTLNSQISVLESEKLTLQSSIETLTAEKQALENQISALQAQLDEVEQYTITIDQTNPIDAIIIHDTKLNTVATLSDSTINQLRLYAWQDAQIKYADVQDDVIYAVLNGEVQDSSIVYINGNGGQTYSVSSRVGELTTDISYFKISNNEVQGLSTAGQNLYNVGELTTLVIPTSYSLENRVLEAPRNFVNLSSYSDLSSSMVSKFQSLILSDGNIEREYTSYTEFQNVAYDFAPDAHVYIVSMTFKTNKGLANLFSSNYHFFNYPMTFKYENDIYTLESSDFSSFFTNNYSQYSVMYFSGYTYQTDIVVEGNDYQITSIGENSFRSHELLQKVIISDGITSIGLNAFTDCSSLRNVKLSNTLITIGQNAFYGCNSIKKISIPASVTTIGNSAFGIISFDEVDIKTTAFRNQSTYSLESDGTLKVYSMTDNPAWFTAHINPLVKSIDFSEFSGTSIGNYAFQCCSSLVSVDLPEGITSIGTSAFDNCVGLKRFVVPSTVNTLGEFVISGCSLDFYEVRATAFRNQGTYSLELDGTLKVYSMTDNPVWYQNHVVALVTSIDFSEFSGTSIGSYAFSRCSLLKNVVIPDTITDIGSYAFNSNYYMESITLNSAVPPTLHHAYTFGTSQVYPIYVPAESLDAYKSASYWSADANRIQAIN